MLRSGPFFDTLRELEGMRRSLRRFDVPSTFEFPAINMWVSEDNAVVTTEVPGEDIIVMADMPGADEKTVDITLEKNVLTIYGKVEADIPKDHTLSVSEYGIGDYQRVFTLSDEVDSDNIQATVKNGVLKLIMPKAAPAKTRKIPVQA